MNFFSMYYYFIIIIREVRKSEYHYRKVNKHFEAFLAHIGPKMLQSVNWISNIIVYDNGLML